MKDKRIGLGVQVERRADDHRFVLVSPWHIDLEALVEGRLLITGNSGSGKSRTIRRLIEQAFGQIQIIVLDREGEYSSLRERYDFLLIGGENGDSPVEVSRAETLCRTLIEISASAVIDIYELTTEQQYAFVARFINELMLVKPSERRHIMLVIDEADFFADQDQPKSECTTAMKELAQRGRKRGLVPVMATNRPAQIAKSVSAPCVNKIIGRQSDDVDVTRALKNLGFARSRSSDVVELDAGYFWCKGPAFDEQRPTLVHVGDVQTTHPRLGMKPPPPPPPSARVAELLAALNVPLATPATDLGTGLETVAGKVDMGPALAREYQRGYDNGYVQGRIYHRGNVYDALKAIDSSFEQLAVSELPVVQDLDLKGPDWRLQVMSCPTPGNGVVKEATRAALTDLGKAAVKFIAVPPDVVPVFGGKIGAPKARSKDGLRLTFLRTLAEHGALSRHRLHLWSDYRETGTSKVEIAQMIRTGLVSVPEPGMVAITDDGRKLVPDAKKVKRRDLLDHVLNCDFLSSAEKRFLTALKGSPNGLSRKDLHERVGLRKTGTTGQSLSRMQKLGLLTVPKVGHLSLSQELTR